MHVLDEQGVLRRVLKVEDIDSLERDYYSNYNLTINS